MAEVFYRPRDAWVGDVIPYFEDGVFRLFYLHDWRDRAKHGEGFPWFQLATRDFTSFEECGVMIPKGSQEEQDLYVGTGSVIKVGSLYHLYYTGDNPHYTERGLPRQGVMHAVSPDLLSWRKIPEDTFVANPDLYESNDWRDPFVFWNNDVEEYWMLLAARLKTGPSRRRGCIALCKSKDMHRWAVQEPFWAPGLYYTHECPEVFKGGGYYYLVYSTFSDRFATHYRFSKSLSGPWQAAASDTFDGSAFYAGKTASDGKHRFMFGWNPTREGARDYENWDWGGNLVVHEVCQESDGSLSVQLPPAVRGLFTTRKETEFHAAQGNCSIKGNQVTVDAPGSFGCALASPLQSSAKIEMTFRLMSSARELGVILRASEDAGEGYQIRILPLENRMTLDSWPRRPGKIFMCVSTAPHMAELERTIRLDPTKSHELFVIVEDTICEVYLDRSVAMSARLYDHTGRWWGVYATEGKVLFSDIEVRTR